jgi:hypothetical protein
MKSTAMRLQRVTSSRRSRMPHQVRVIAQSTVSCCLSPACRLQLQPLVRSIFCLLLQIGTELESGSERSLAFYQDVCFHRVGSVTCHVKQHVHCTMMPVRLQPLAQNMLLSVNKCRNAAALPYCLICAGSFAVLASMADSGVDLASQVVLYICNRWACNCV